MPGIKQSVVEWCFLQEHVPSTYYKRLKQIGFSGAELVAAQHFDTVRAAGLTVLSIAAPGMKNGLSNRDLHKTLLPQIHNTILLARDNAIPVVVVFTGIRGERQSEDDAVKSCAAGLERLVHDAAQAGVTLALENISASAVPGALAGQSGHVFSIIREVGSPALKACFDAYHAAAMAEDVERAIIENIDSIVSIHVSGYPGRGFPGGNQSVDYAMLVRDACQAGYDGYWAHEFLPAADSLEQLEEAHALFALYAA